MIKKADYITLPYERLAFIAVVFLTIVVAPIIFFSTNKTPDALASQPSVQHAEPTKILSTSSDPNKANFHGYSEQERWFTLSLPPECFSDESKIILCSANGFSVLINPQDLGRDVTPVSKDTIKLNNHTWNRVVSNDDVARVYYSMETDALHPENPGQKANYLISAEFDPLTPESQKYFETILTSFRFIE